ncbi:NAD(P)/FAD-dependent oxidoreductase [Actinomadura algeriensis]|uniref:Glycine/D-amino acid oxidase-like deaminating enzyme n=1 Tax=Actinomadura algeriensis TaxID=1679523 RepID=A0ABR9K1C6_9ACTN|nr:FAD-dependent oxidoreductase [Actinomadura algeriensis]MBE1536646.1 glycine/D-amino acid oxidase-like deaminating enzyme [Actinomadura algeriensis]
MRIVIVGGGIIGAALADRLAPAAEVTLVEQDRPGAATSGASYAWLNANDPADARYHSFRVAALDAWRRVAAGFGDPGWCRFAGNSAWAVAEPERDELAGRVARLRDLGYPAEPTTAAGLREVEPSLRPPAGAVVARFPGEGHVHGSAAVEALLGRARDAGARVLTGTAASRLNVRADRVTGVRTATGDDLVADVTICAAGWRSPLLLSTAGAGLPLVDAEAPGSSAPGLTATTTPVPGLVNGVVHSPGLDLRPTPEGGLVLEAADLDAATDLATSRAELDARAAELLDRARAMFPGLTARLDRVRRCVRPLPLDGRPLVGPQRPGLYTVVTHSGITLGPYLADLVAGEILGEAAEPALAPYRPDRPTP